jgi:predicted transcriptional regulator
MTLKEIAEKLDLEVVTGPDGLDREVTGGYASDLMSDVIANSRAGDLWVTLQIHQNVVAVAALNNLSAVVLVNGRRPEEAAVEKARTEEIPILITDLPAFEIIGRLYNLGIPGVHDAEGV